MARKERSLREKESALNERIAAMKKKEAKCTALEQELVIDRARIDRLQTTWHQRREQLVHREAKMKEAEADLESAVSSLEMREAQVRKIQEFERQYNHNLSFPLSLII